MKNSKPAVKPLLASISPLEKNLSYLSDVFIVLGMYESRHAMDNPSADLLKKFYFLILLYVLFHSLLLKSAHYEYHFVPDISSQEYAKNQRDLRRKNKLRDSHNTHSGFDLKEESAYIYIQETYSEDSAPQYHQITWQPGQRQLETQARNLNKLLRALQTGQPSLKEKYYFPTLPGKLTQWALFNPFEKSLIFLDFVPFLRLMGYADVFLCIRQVMGARTAIHPAWIILNAVILFIALTVNTYTANHRNQISKCEGFSLKALWNNSLLCLENLARREYLIYPTTTFEELLTFIIHAENTIGKIREAFPNKENHLYRFMNSELKMIAKKLDNAILHQNAGHKSQFSTR